MKSRNKNPLSGKRVTVMGLGLHGGGIATCRFLAERGAIVTATDLRDEQTLAPSRAQLADLEIRYRLGEHVMEDFHGADMVIKNPAVRLSSPYLRAAQEAGVPIESDISLFLREFRGPLLAVTGSKGKSTTVSALFHGLKQHSPACRLGGNITISPLTFLDELQPEAPVILELSSWQLADLKGKGRLHPQVACITNIFPDHQNSYNSMIDYVADKQLIYREQSPDAWTLLPGDGEWTNSFRDDSPAREVLLFSRNPSPPTKNSAWLDEAGRGWFHPANAAEAVELVPEETELPGIHNRYNLLCAGVMLHLFGLNAAQIAPALAAFPGIPHRMEKVGVWQGVTCFNDSAATIPDATAAAVRSVEDPARLVLIAGGTDKELVVEPWREVAGLPKMWVLLAGTATDRLLPFLEEAGAAYRGPFQTMREAVEAAGEAAEPGDTMVLSPGATSFGLFLNEFDRGDQFRELIKAKISEK